jgi:hypothetical protein
MNTFSLPYDHLGSGISVGVKVIDTHFDFGADLSFRLGKNRCAKDEKK